MNTPTQKKTAGHYLRLRPLRDKLALGRKLARIRNRHARIVNFTSDPELVQSVDQPLVLITQIQRSGGTLLSQLFDNHPECWGFPSELFWVKQEWPSSDYVHMSPAKAHSKLHEFFFSRFSDMSRTGYHKFAHIDGGQRLPFRYAPGLDRHTFIRLWRTAPPSSLRGVFDIFFTAFFDAWLDYQNKADAEKKFVTAFSPRTNMLLAARDDDAFFSTYPNGRIITVVRDPVAWYASAKRHSPIYTDLDQAMQLWTESTKASIVLRNLHPHQVKLVMFETLAGNTEASMKALADWLGIAQHPTLSTPTFNGYTIKSDSSFESVEGVDASVIERGARSLGPALCDSVNRIGRALYEDAARLENVFEAV